jgi:WD40 repeat protein
MKTRRLLICSLYVGIGLGLSGPQPLRAQPGSAPPAKQPLTFPINLGPAGGKAGKSLECLVPYGPLAGVAAVAFSPDGKLLAMGGYQDVLIWDLPSARLLRRIGLGPMSNLVQDVAFHKDGVLLAVAEGTPAGPGAVRVFHVAEGRMVMDFSEPKDVVYSLAFSPDGRWLAAGGAESLVHLWSVTEKKHVTSLKEHTDWIDKVTFSPDGKFLATAGEDRTAFVWEVGTWKRLARLEEKDPIHGAAFSPDGQFLLLALAGASDQTLRLRKRADGELARATDLGAAVPADVLWVPPTNRIVVPCRDAAIKIFDGGNGNLVANLVGHAGWVDRVAVSPDGARLASASSDGTVKLWSVAEGRLLATLVQLTPGTDEWLIMSSAGYLATSSPSVLQWKASGLTTPPAGLTTLLQNADLIKKALNGSPVPAANIP